MTVQTAAPNGAATPPAPQAPPAAKGPVDYRAAAIAAWEAQEAANVAEKTPAPQEASATTPESPPAEGGAAASEQPVDGKPPDADASTPKEEEAKKDSALPEGAQAKSKLELRALTAVARANRQLREREEALKRREAEVTGRQAPKTALEALKAAGFSYEQATEELVTGRSASTQAQAPKELPEVVALQKELKELRQTVAQQEERAAQAEFSSALSQVVAKTPDDFELVARYAQHPRLSSFTRIKEVLLEHHANTGSMPAPTLAESLRIAAQHVEKELEDEILGPGLTAKKVRGRILPADTKREPVGGPRAKSGHQESSTTLTNAAASGAPVRTAPQKPRSDEDYRRAALAVLERGS